MAEPITILITAEDRASAPMRGVARQASDMDASVRKVGGGFEALASAAKMGMAAVATAMAAGTAAAGAFVASSVQAAGDFEGGMNTFAAASGLAGAELEAFKTQFIELGQELPVSTTAVQDAATAMVKGGIDPAIVAAGGLRDTLQFSLAAGFATLEEAANASAKLLSTWGDATASAADQALFMASAQELLTKSANASTLDADKLSEAMLMAAGSAKSAGVEYEEFVTIMGATSGAFSTAAVQGTSFNNFFTRLIPQTKGAKAAMEDLGLYTKEAGSLFYDAQGQFIGMEAAAQLMQEAFAGLSDAQLSEAMATIFGNDAKNAALAVMEQGAIGYQNFSAAMANANGIQEQATATQQGLNFAMENMKGSIEALQITIGTRLLPLLTPLITQFTGVLNAAIGVASALFDAGLGSGEFLESLGLLDTALGMAPGSAEAAYTAFMQIATTVQSYIPPALALAQAAFANISAFIATVMPSIVAIVSGALTFIAAFWQAHGATILQVASSIWVAIQGAIQVVLGVIQGVIAIATATITGDWTTAFTQLDAANTTIWSGIQTFLFGVLNAIAAFFGTSVDELIALWSSNLSKLATIATTAINDALTAFRAAIAPAAEIGSAIISGIVSGISGGAGKLAKAATDAANSALKAAKEALGIKSPSSVFADSVGLPIAQGMAQGITAGLGQVLAAGGALASAALAGATGGVGAGVGLTAGVPALAAGGGGGNTTNVTIGSMPIHAERGMDENRLADRVVARIGQAIGGRR